MTQLAHARALHMLADTGIDPDTARYIMKRLYDFGFTARARDTGPGADPPGRADAEAPIHPAKAARRAARTDAIRSMRDEVAAAREAKAAELAAGIAAEQARRAEEDAARERALGVARILAQMGDPADPASSGGPGRSENQPEPQPA